MTEKSQGSATQPVVNNAVGGTHKVCAEFEINMLEVIAHVALICVYLLYYTHTSKRRQNLNTRGCLGSGSVGCGREESHVMSFHMNSLVLLFFFMGLLACHSGHELCPETAICPQKRALIILIPKEKTRALIRRDLGSSPSLPPSSWCVTVELLSLAYGPTDRKRDRERDLRDSCQGRRLLGIFPNGIRNKTTSILQYGFFL